MNYVGESDIFMAVNTKNRFCDASLNERWRFINEKENRRNEIKKHAKIKTREKKIHSNYLSLICILCYMFCCYCSTIYREWRYGPLDVDWLEIIKLLIETTNYETATSISQHIFSFGWSFWVLESKKYYMKMLWPSHIENSKWNSEITR